MSEILLSIDSFQIRQVNDLITELQNLCKENNLSKEETKLTMLNMFKSAYPTYAYETADKIERAKLVEKIYKNIDNIKTNLNSFIHRKETELEATADNSETEPEIPIQSAPETEPQTQTQLNDHSSYLILPTRLLEALLKTAGNKKDNPHRMHLQSIGISTKNKMIFSTNGKIYLGLYDTEFSPDIDCQDKSLNAEANASELNPHLIMPDVLLYAEDVKIFLKSLKTLATEDKKVDKNLCLLKYTPANLDEDLPNLTLYSSNRALKKEVLAFNDDDTSFMTYKFTETCLNVDYLNENITDKNDAILDINYLTTLLDAYRKLTLNDYLDFSKFLHIKDKETDFEGKMYHDTDRNLIAGIACVRK